MKRQISSHWTKPSNDANIEYCTSLELIALRTKAAWCTAKSVLHVAGQGYGQRIKAPDLSFVIKQVTVALRQIYYDASQPQPDLVFVAVSPVCRL